MIILIPYLIVLLVYFKCPKYLKAVIFVINFFMPDPLPMVDELVMVAGLFA